MYRENYVFPLTEAYAFAKEVGGKIATKAKAISRRGTIKDTFIDEMHGGTSQARRALMYLLLNKFGLFKQFENEYWDEDDGKEEIINELERDYIDNKKLANNKHLLPYEVRDLFQ